MEAYTNIAVGSKETESSRLAVFSEQLEVLNKSLNSAIHRINGISDRMYGERPEVEGNPTEMRAIVSGVIGQMDSAFQDLQATSDRLHAAIERLQDL